MKYCIVRKIGYVFDTTIDDVEKEVNERIKEGWMPHGNLIIEASNYFVVAQAMILTEEN